VDLESLPRQETKLILQLVEHTLTPRQALGAAHLGQSDVVGLDHRIRIKEPVPRTEDCPRSPGGFCVSAAAAKQFRLIEIFRRRRMGRFATDASDQDDVRVRD
jgi:hypothetical protein